MDFFSKLHYGRRNGIVSILVSFVFFIVNYLSIQYSDYYSPNLIYVATICLSLGVVLMFVPGVDVKKGDFVDGAGELVFVVKNSSTFAKMVWVFAIIVGIIIGLLVNKEIGGPLLNL